ncbi:MAG: flagellar motor protein MotB [Smithellaceae bacterium]
MNNLSKTPHPADPLNQVPLRKTSSQMRSLTQPVPAEAGNEIWFLTLSDLLMLLLIFFVLLFGITIKQQSTPPTSTSPQTEKVLPAAVTKEQPVSQQVFSAPTGDAANASLAADLTGIIDGHSGLQGITVARHSQYVVLTFPEQIIFDSGQAQLKSAAQPVLEQVAVFIKNHPNMSVEIQGHTDNRPIASRRYPSNWELSADRATQVAKSLVQLGINPAKISTKGFGEYHPLYDNSNDFERLKNRRVELQFSLTPAS